MSNRTVLAILVAVILIAGILFIRFGLLTEEAKYKRQVNAFIECLPEPLNDAQIDEVRSILDRFRLAVKRGEAFNEDIREVTSRLAHHIDEGKIGERDLQVFMARVSYLSLRNRPEHQSEEGEIRPPDHPLLEEHAQEQPADTTDLRE